MQEEERLLAQRVAQLQREQEAAMAALERRFLTDAEALQVLAWQPAGWSTLLGVQLLMGDKLKTIMHPNTCRRG